jgi:hypothetical protein
MPSKEHLDPSVSRENVFRSRIAEGARIVQSWPQWKKEASYAVWIIVRTEVRRDAGVNSLAVTRTRCPGDPKDYTYDATTDSWTARSGNS